MKTTYKAFSLAVLAALVMTLVLPFTALASDLQRVSAGGRLARFVDDEGLLTAKQAAELTAKLDEISERHQFDTVVVVVDALDRREARLYAVDFFEQNGFGFGRDLDGIVLLLAMRDRDFGFAVLGYGLEAFTDAGQEYLEKLFLPHLRADDYYKAFMVYADAVDDFLDKAEAGKPYNKGNIPTTPEERSKQRLYSIVGSLIAALLAALAVTGMWRGQLKSVRKQNLANAYIIDGSMKVTLARENFLHRNVTRTQRASSSGKSGGGSFRSSSGRSSSGRSGKF